MSLDAILKELAACRICRDAPRYGAPLGHEPRPVIQADPRARLCIAGQAPGVRVHRSGRPFTDPSGVRLRQWLGLDESVFYDPARLAIVPMGHCFPGVDAKGSDLPPRRECAEAWRARIFAALPAIELVVVLGQYALRWHRPGRYSAIAEAVADHARLLAEAAFPRVIVLPHPSWRNNAWLRANPWFEADLLPPLRKEVQRLTADRAEQGPFAGHP